MTDPDATAPTTHFPFSAVVGQDRLKLALILCAISPDIGGVLIRGEKGTAKSTIVRALAPLLPGGDDGPSGGGGRVVDLPIGATEDRVIGSLDVARVLRDGDTGFTPGLLAAADRGVLYIDEVNLLADHLVDLLLDAAAMGRVVVERDAVSHTYPARFMLVGTMNPEEGELRPQLLDRFGLAVSVAAPRDVDERVSVVVRRMEYDAHPDEFAERWRAADDEVARRIGAARVALEAVTVPPAELRRIAGICTHLDVDGLRADIVVAKAARAHAAWRGSDRVDETDVRVAVELALPHRRRRDPFDESYLSDDDLRSAMESGREAADQAPDKSAGQTPTDQGPEADRGRGERTGPAPDRNGDGPDSGPTDRPASDTAPTDTAASDTAPTGPDPGSGDPDDPGPGGGSALPAPDDDASTRATAHQQSSRPLSFDASAGTEMRASVTRRLRVEGIGDGEPGRRSPARSARGHTIGSDRYRGGAVHLTASVLAAVERTARPATPGAGSRGVVRLAADDLRGPVRVGREGNLVVFCVDLSGSMTARRRLDAVSGACATLLRDSYQRRDRVAVITARGRDAEIVVPPTRSADIALRRLTGARTGGRTPLAEGLTESLVLIHRARRTDPRRRALLVIVTDGRATAGPDAARRGTIAADRLRRHGVTSVVIDCERGPVRLGLARTLAGHLGGDHVAIGELSADAVSGVVRAAA